MSESVLLGLLGGALGVALAAAGLALLRAFAPANIPRLADVALDPVALLFALGTSVFAGVLFGAIPALKYARVRFGIGLRSGRAVGVTRERHRARGALVTLQVALKDRCARLPGRDPRGGVVGEPGPAARRRLHAWRSLRALARSLAGWPNRRRNLSDVHPRSLMQLATGWHAPLLQPATSVALDHYASKQEWSSQFIERPLPTEHIVAGGMTGIVERAPTADRLLMLVGPPNVAADALEACARCAQKAGRGFFHVTTSAELAQASRSRGLAVRAGYLMVQDVAERSGSNVPRHATWRVHSGDRM